MKRYRSEDAKWIQGQGYSKRIILPEKDLGIPGSLIQEVKFRQGDKVPLHHHNIQTEIFYAKDEAHFEINGERIKMMPGDIIICEPGDVHGNPSIPHDFTILVLKINYDENDFVWD